MNKFKPVLVKDLQAIGGTKGQILAEEGNIVLVKTNDIYTVWVPETGFHITNTRDFEEAQRVFLKHASILKGLL